METVNAGKSFLESLSAESYTPDGLPFDDLYSVQIKPTEEFPLKDLIKIPKNTNFVFVQQYQEPKESQSEESINNESYIVEQDVSVISDSDTIDIDTTLPGFRSKLSGIRPLTVKQARWILSVYTMANNPYMNKQLISDAKTTSDCKQTTPDCKQTISDSKTISESPASVPIWIPCDGQQPEDVFYMGGQTVRSPSGQISGIATFKVSCAGPITNKASLPSFGKLLQEHKYYNDSKSVVTHGYAEYDVFGSLTNDASLLPGQLSQHSSLKIECVWENVNHILQKPPHNAKATVSIQAVPGDTISATHSMFRELHTLVSFAQGLQTGQVNWARKPSEDEESLTDKTLLLVKELQKGTLQKLDESKISNEFFDSPLHHQMVSMPKREGLDFTERLWKLFMGATCYKDVIDSFNAVFQALNSGELQPMVHRNNVTQMAKMVRLSYDRKLNDVKLEENIPLELLVEIGIDKLRRDYITYFIAEKLATLSDLDFYTQCGLDIDQQLERVQRLFNVVELSLDSKIYLQLPLQNQRSLISDALKHYENNEHTHIHTFQLTLDAALFRNLYATIQPRVWKVEMRSPSDITSVYQLSSRPVFDHVSLSQSQDVSISLELDENLHYFSTSVLCGVAEFGGW